MPAIKTATVLEHYELKLSEAALRLVGMALQKLPMEQVYPTVMDIERQIQEQNFQLQQAEVQQKVTNASAEIERLAPDNGPALAAAALSPDAPPPVVALFPADTPAPAEAAD